MLPVIGVTASVSDDRLSFQQKRMYCEAISACGGLPLILPPQEDVSRASQVLSLLDGLLLAGGDDIDPAYYDEKTSFVSCTSSSIPSAPCVIASANASNVFSGAYPLAPLCANIFVLLNVYCLDSF